MSLRLVVFAVVLALSADAAIADDTAATAAGTDAPQDDVRNMTPTQLRAEKESLRREIVVKREENAETRQFIETLEQHNAELAARKAELDARLAEIQERLERLEAAQDK